VIDVNAWKDILLKAAWEEDSIFRVKEYTSACRNPGNAHLRNMVEIGDNLTRLHAGLFSSYFVITMITIVFFFFKTFYLWLKKILQYPTKHILADSANIKATCVDKEKESFDPIAEAQYILQKMNQEPDASDDFGLDAKHKKKITDRQWEKKLLKRIGTKEENADTDFHF
jgi:hypothetical protein|tara:strand:+ start:28 stop:537 length:510 start_codon:yes stop_codon:yes gene_type:complete